MEEAAHLLRFAPGKTVCSVAFFPGCQLGASDPRYVLRSYAWLLKQTPDAALWLSCCGAPALWSGVEEEIQQSAERLRTDWETLGCPEVVVACPTCRKMLARLFPEMKTRFLIEEMDEAGFDPHRKMADQAYAVFDPCAARFEEGLFQSVRNLAEKAGIPVAELPQNKNDSRCCSWGGHVSIANPEYAHTQIAKRTEQSDLPYLAYCSNCRDIFAKAGKPCLHIFDVLFDLGDEHRKAPGWTERRRNREQLQAEAQETFWGEAVRPRIPETPKLLISEELRTQMSDDHILEDDVREVIDFIEKEGRTVTFPESGEKSGFHMIGNATIWVAYIKEEGERICLTKVYAHRMRIVLEETWNGRRVETDL
jgi:hypothetical protein